MKNKTFFKDRLLLTLFAALLFSVVIYTVCAAAAAEESLSFRGLFYAAAGISLFVNLVCMRCVVKFLKNHMDDAYAENKEE
ncbi:MAG: hypothetical protein IJM42_00140 [Synergistes sp.]|nr:hypothetical protein [Synergistes sp.]MCR5335644.1 hypothetical protein [Synergistes sp.]